MDKDVAMLEDIISKGNKSDKDDSRSDSVFDRDSRRHSVAMGRIIETKEENEE